MPTQHPLPTSMSLGELDDRLDQGKTRGLRGLKVDWHGACVGTIVRLGKVFAVRIQLPCAHSCGKRITLFVKSGLHNGAFVYTCDRQGKIDGHNLRDEIVCCDPDCRKKKP